MNLNAFAKDIRDLMIDNIPVESDADFLKKHIKRGKKLFQAVAGDSSSQVIPIGLNSYAFELGSPNLEQNFPHYHILEDAYTIKKRGKGTATSKGTQDKVAKENRDYGGWTVSTNINKKTGEKSYSVYQEYRKNVRGKRKPKEKYKLVNKNGTQMFETSSSSYVNRHYHYLEKTFDKGLPYIAQKYQMRMGRVQINNEEKDSALRELFF